ncbi:MAG TPA: Trk system potassium transporter TrkA [Candidatus Polarisedimenticolaceae bacterium]|nr:Trk system potassium transporter TrkA [Candidatus Polarisedimenticolaceae bacterium]
MKVFIVGAGEVGIHIAQSLVREGHDLVLIERDAKKVSQLQSKIDVLAVCGDGCNPRTLRQHGAGDADLFFAVSDKDPVNLLAALTARELGARRAVVRVADPDLGRNPLVQKDKELLLLYPERLVAQEIFSLTRVPGAGKARFFREGKLVLLQARPSIMAPIYGRPVKDLVGPKNWILTGIHRATGTVIPRGDTVLRPGDLIFSVGPTETMHDYLASIGVESNPTKKVVIAGAGQVGASLARLLVKEKIRVVVVQRGASKAFDLAAELPEVLVLRGDATEPEMLRDAGIQDADYFVAATQRDEANLLTSLLARELGARAVVALYNQPEFLSVMQAVRIDIPLSPRLMIAGHILRMVHRQEIISMDLVAGGNAEVLELVVPARARVSKRPLNRLNFPRDAIVGAVIRQNESFVPTGEFQFAEGDRALVFTLTETLPEVERMFRGR